MARKVTKIQFTPPVSDSATHTNREGYPAWERPIEEQFLQTVLTNTLGRAYYASQKDLIHESNAVHTAMLAKDAAFYARGLVLARNSGYMRLQPIYGLARLSEVDTKLFGKVFGQVIRTPNDLKDFVTLTMSRRKGSQGGRAIKRAVGTWLSERLNEYWVIKYGSKTSSDVSLSLKDLVRVYHPKNGNHQLMRYILQGVYDEKELPKIAAFEALKRATTDEEKIRAIQNGNLPHEVASSSSPSPAVWEAILPQLPIFALLRNLNTLERHNVLNQNGKLIMEKLTNPDAVHNSKILPSQFLRAYNAVSNAQAKDAIIGAMDIAVDNLEELPGKTVVALDRSGSMDAFMQTAAIFAISLMKKTNYQGRLFLFNHEVGEIPVLQRDSVLTQANMIVADGGTDTSKFLHMMIKDKVVADNLILISDEQQNIGTPFADLLSQYRKEVNLAVKVFIIDVSPYRNAITPPEWDNVWFVYGWSDQVLNFISAVIRGFGTLVEYVNAAVEV